jgi:hypothetical protein
MRGNGHVLVGPQRTASGQVQPPCGKGLAPSPRHARTLTWHRMAMLHITLDALSVIWHPWGKASPHKTSLMQQEAAWLGLSPGRTRPRPCRAD